MTTRATTPRTATLFALTLGLGALALPTTARAQAATDRVERIGDAAAWRVELERFDRAKETATLHLDQPAHLIVLAVVPGEEIELITPNFVDGSERPRSGRLTLPMQRVATPPENPADAPRTSPTAGYCAASVTQAYAAQLPKRTRVDSTGRTVSVSPVKGDVSAVLNNPDLMRYVDRAVNQCAQQGTYRMAPTYLAPPRPMADRYLVVLASPVPLSTTQIMERLAGVGGTDASALTSIGLITRALYERDATPWGGMYVAW
jgi:hypothetical protein